MMQRCTTTAEHAKKTIEIALQELRDLRGRRLSVIFGSIAVGAIVVLLVALSVGRLSLILGSIAVGVIAVLVWGLSARQKIDTDNDPRTR
jgi:hypothetical protein